MELRGEDSPWADAEQGVRRPLGASVPYLCEEEAGPSQPGELGPLGVGMQEGRGGRVVAGQGRASGFTKEPCVLHGQYRAGRASVCSRDGDLASERGFIMFPF